MSQPINKRASRASVLISYALAKQALNAVPKEKGNEDGEGLNDASKSLLRLSVGEDPVERSRSENVDLSSSLRRSITTNFNSSSGQVNKEGLRKTNIR